METSCQCTLRADAPGKTYPRTVFNPEWGCLSEFVGEGNPIEDTLFIGDAGVEKIYVKPVPNSELGLLKFAVGITLTLSLM